MAQYGQNRAAADFGAMKVAFEQFQNAVQDCQGVQGRVDNTKAALMTNYAGGSAQVYLPKLIAWQEEFTKVKGALARMTLELSNSEADYQRQEDQNKEISNAISAQLLG